MKRYSKQFTLIELITAMAIFSILMVVMMKFFNEAQQAWTKSSQRSMVYNNARVALNLISRDLQCAYYKQDVTPFWHWRADDPATVNWGPEFSNELLAFISTTPMPQNEDCTSPYNEIKYQLYYATDPADSNAGWLMRSVTGNKTNSTTANTKYNATSTFMVGFTTDDGPPKGLTDGILDSAFTADDSSSEPYHKVIPCVTKLMFTCYDKTGTVITPDNSTSKVVDNAVDTQFPYIVKVDLSLLDNASWNKWIALGATPDDALADTDPPTALEFRKKNERAFTKMIFLGERGQ